MYYLKRAPDSHEASLITKHPTSNFQPPTYKFIYYFYKMNISSLYELYLRNPSVQTDTRKLQPGDLFFALKGDNFNGNKFAKQAIEAGAACAVIDEAAYAIDGKTFLVDDVLTSLQELAKHHRQHGAARLLGTKTAVAPEI